MAKVLHGGEWYEQLSSEALYEEEYERLIKHHANSLFPLYHLIDFKKTVYSDLAGAKADFALVHESYRDWWVVEAELSHHSFEYHVRPQIETLSRAMYDDEIISYLHTKRPDLDRNRMHSVIRGKPPGILVVVNRPMPEWGRELKRYSAIVTVLEVFRSRRNQHLYRLNGEQPPEFSTLKSTCVVELARFLRVLSPGVLPISHNERMPIQFGGGVTEWTRTDLQDRVYLTNLKPVSLRARAHYELYQREDGTFALSEEQ